MTRTWEGAAVWLQERLGQSPVLPGSLPKRVQNGSMTLPPPPGLRGAHRGPGWESGWLDRRLSTSRVPGGSGTGTPAHGLGVSPEHKSLLPSPSGGAWVTGQRVLPTPAAVWETGRTAGLGRGRDGGARRAKGAVRAFSGPLAHPLPPSWGQLPQPLRAVLFLFFMLDYLPKVLPPGLCCPPNKMPLNRPGVCRPPKTLGTQMWGGESPGKTPPHTHTHSQALDRTKRAALLGFRTSPLAAWCEALAQAPAQRHPPDRRRRAGVRDTPGLAATISCLSWEGFGPGGWAGAPTASVQLRWRKGVASCYSHSSPKLDRREQAAELARGDGRMTPRGRPFQRLLLLLAGASVLDAQAGTTVPPHNASYILEEKLNASLLELELVYKLMRKTPKAYPVFQEAMYQLEAKECWDRFAHQMASVGAVHLCEWRIVSRPYASLTACLEEGAEKLQYGYPNALAESYIVGSHRRYFLNCTLERPLLLDPPENVLLTLILAPICLIPVLVTLVVLKSKDGETQLPSLALPLPSAGQGATHAFKTHRWAPSLLLLVPLSGGKVTHHLVTA
ncbi:receptor activity-modifying protein 2 isoform X2 [Paroedura picta]|uniref:receptor activity-modifying protein 2 isoform X2 n=1 Tax=Paroedura picta TaxID=143630 RepID=UPI004056F9AB